MRTRDDLDAADRCVLDAFAPASADDDADDDDRTDDDSAVAAPPAAPCAFRWVGVEPRGGVFDAAAGGSEPLALNYTLAGRCGGVLAPGAAIIVRDLSSAWAVAVGHGCADDDPSTCDGTVALRATYSGTFALVVALERSAAAVDAGAPPALARPPPPLVLDFIPQPAELARAGRAAAAGRVRAVRHSPPPRPRRRRRGARLARRRPARGRRGRRA